MPPKKTEQDKSSEVLASTLDCGYMLQELLARDARSETLAHLILQLYGYSPREQERSETEIDAEIQSLQDALSRDYGVPLPLPTENEVAEIHQEIIEDVESGSVWLLPAEAEILTLFDTAFPALTAHIRDVLSTQQVPDLLAPDAVDQFVDQIISPLLGLSGQEMEDDIRDHLKLLVQAVMAERHAQNYLAFSAEEQEAWIRHALAQRVKDRIVNIRGYSVLRMTQNWVAPGEQHIAQGSDGTPVLETSAGYPPPRGGSPTLSITIDLSRVHLVGVTELAQKLALSVNEALQKLEKLPQEWNPFPEELRFLRTISCEDFERDLYRFDLHRKHGLNLRQIAFLEEAERRGRYLLPSSLQHIKISMSVPGEDGVEKSVKRIIKAIDRKPYRARRRRIDTPGLGQEDFFCPDHPPRACPTLDCPHLKEWMGRFDAKASTDSTGRGKEIVSFDQLQAKREKD